MRGVGHFSIVAPLANEVDELLVAGSPYNWTTDAN